MMNQKRHANIPMLSSFNTLENENNTINRDDKIVTECTRILDVSSESYDQNNRENSSNGNRKEMF